ncbi:MAG: DMT family transporter [Deltaproteobacteria bacterium]|nr:MAG: DMT family transporter [Deltaproteobacteria bacterium]
MNQKVIKSDALLLLTAVIWGFAFVAQRIGMDHVGPFTFNGIRFALGGLSLTPFIIYHKRHEPFPDKKKRPGAALLFFLGSTLAGIFLFAGASLQQVGIVYTTAGNAGFITGLYVVIVPVMGLLWKQRAGAGTWIGAFLAAIGLYFLSVTQELTIGKGDFLVLISAFIWASHVLIIGWLSPKTDSIQLAAFQFAVCSVLSLCTAVVFETIVFANVMKAAIPILYGGLMSVGVAYTLQVVAQKDAHPAHASILLSLETVFAAIGGWIVLNEILSIRGLFGCCLMMAGMLISQLWSRKEAAE